ncbi:DciA family protein [Alkalimarinus coralli]|uniref:DciA family protein n=1 Tax=Alkalimarinus coralli TaxID=2935863 RepID=UPI00202ACCE3|nr:DciA family protein [Alkalimarinus coralli]
MKNEKLTEKRSLAQITRKTHDLNRLFRKADAISKLNKELDQALPESLKGQFKISGYKDRVLKLVVHSAALATRLKFTQAQLIQKLRANPVLKELQSITIKVRPSRHKKKLVRKLQPISNENAQLLKEEAGQTEDIDLKNVLLKLATRTRHHNE